MVDLHLSFKYFVDSISFAHVSDCLGNDLFLHGHNVQVFLGYSLTKSIISFDTVYNQLKLILQKILDELEHKTIFSNRYLLSSDPEFESSLVFIYKGKRYVIPKSDVILISFSSSSLSDIVSFIGEKFKRKIMALDTFDLSFLEKINLFFMFENNLVGEFSFSIY